MSIHRMRNNQSTGVSNTQRLLDMKTCWKTKSKPAAHKKLEEAKHTPQQVPPLCCCAFAVSSIVYNLGHRQPKHATHCWVLLKMLNYNKVSSSLEGHLGDSEGSLTLIGEWKMVMTDVVWTTFLWPLFNFCWARIQRAYCAMLCLTEYAGALREKFCISTAQKCNRINHSRWIYMRRKKYGNITEVCLR